MPLVRFGCFEVDLDAEEIRKNGVRLHLPSQPFRILAFLLEQPGQVVSREQLRTQLWPDGARADFDRSLNTAVNRLRGTLCDSVDSARYIQTLPRRGYRFVAPVDRFCRPAAQVALLPENNGLASPACDSAPAVPTKRPFVVYLLAASLSALAVVAAAWFSTRVTTRPAAPFDITSVLTNYAGTESTPSWSPDGTQIAFSWSGGARRSNLDIYTLSAGSSTPTRMTQSLADEFSPSYSPDGRRIAFYRRAGDSAYVHVISADPRNPLRLAGFGLNVGPEGPLSSSSSGTPAPDLASLSWSPDAKLIAYVDKGAPADPYSIFLLSVAGSHGEKITWPQAGARGDGYPSFSPDGRMLAFVRSLTEGNGDVYVVAAGGGDPHRLTSDNSRIRGIAWSRDSKSIVFSSERSGEPNLWRVSVSGAAPERLPQVRERAVLPAIPAHGDGLAFVRWSSRGQIVRAPLLTGRTDSAGSGRHTDGFPGDASNPRFSPDGARITFSLVSSNTREIYLSDADGQHRSRLTSFGTYSASPQWSPDGRYIAFDSRGRDDWGVYQIYIVGAEGGSPKAFTTGPVQNSRPSWSSDSRWIYFGSDRSGTLQIWKAPVAGGPARQVTRKGGSEAVESPDGNSVYYSRHGVSGLWSVPVNGGEETLALKDLQWENSRNWVVAREGIYFIHREDSGPSHRKSYLNLFQFGDQRVHQIASLGEDAILNAGCSISRNGRWLLYVQQEEAETDLAMVRGFR